MRVEQIEISTSQHEFPELEPLLKQGQTLKSLSKELGIGKIVKASLSPPRRGWTWFRDDGILKLGAGLILSKIPESGFQSF